MVLGSLATPALAAVEKIDCSESRLILDDFAGMTCETLENEPGADSRGQFDYYGVYGEHDEVFRNLELAVSGLRSYVDPELQLPLRAHFEDRFFWMAEATDWSEVKQAGRLNYITFHLPFGNCIGFYLYEEPREQGYKYALNGVFCHKGERSISLSDLQSYLGALSFK